MTKSHKVYKELLLIEWDPHWPSTVSVRELLGPTFMDSWLQDTVEREEGQAEDSRLFRGRLTMPNSLKVIVDGIYKSIGLEGRRIGNQIEFGLRYD